MTNPIPSAALSVGTGVVSKLVDALIGPQISRLADWAKDQDTERKVLEHRILDRFSDYLLRTYERAAFLNTLVLPNTRLDIHDVYVPLTFTRDRDSSVVHVADKYDPVFFEEHSRFLISDTAGMGKSTVSRWLCLSLIEQGLAVPVYIELRKLRHDHSIIDEVFAQIDPLGDTFDRDLALRLIELGDFVFFLDGYDEIAYDLQESATASIRDFCSKASNNIFIITSRPEASLAAFGEFQRYTIAPLDQSEAFSLIRKYDTVAEYGVADRLIDELTSNDRGGVKDFLTNPFLVSLLYKTYSYNKNIPVKKITFYDEVYQALFKAHDLTKDAFKRQKQCGLDIYDFRLILRRLAFDTARLGSVEYSQAELLDYVAQAKQRTAGLTFNAADFVNDLVLTVPLFAREGNSYKWAHRSIQDYFAAEFIAYSANKVDILEWIYSSGASRFMNVLDLYYELDYATFRRVLIRRLLTDFVAYTEQSYSLVVCASPEDIRERQRLTFGTSVFISREPAFSHHKRAALAPHSRFSAMYFPPEEPSGISAVIATATHFQGQLTDLVISREASTLGAPHKLSELQLLAGPDIENETELNDDPNNPLNRSDTFCKLNSMLRHSRSHKRTHNLDYDKARYVLKTIEAEEEYRTIADSFDV